MHLRNTQVGTSTFASAGLTIFVGGDRYVLILRDHGHRFQGRTLRDLEAKAVNLGRGYEATDEGLRFPDRWPGLRSS